MRDARMILLAVAFIGPMAWMGMELRSERLHRAAVEDKAEKDRREMVRKEVERIDSLMTIERAASDSLAERAMQRMDEILTASAKMTKHEKEKLKRELDAIRALPADGKLRKFAAWVEGAAPQGGGRP